jgi:hypothetical protein
MQVTVAGGVAGTGVLVVNGVSCRLSGRTGVSAPEAVPAPKSRMITTRKIQVRVQDMEKYPVPTFYTR